MLHRVSLAAAVLAAASFFGIAESADANVIRQLTATPSCDGSGECALAVSGFTPYTLNQSMPTAVIDIDIDSPLHVQLFDTDASTETIHLSGIGGFIFAGSLRTTIELTDENGQVITGSAVTRQFTSTGGVFFRLLFNVDYPLSEVIFHDVRITHTLVSPDPNDFFENAVFRNVTFGAFDDNSNVGGRQLPEPATIALFGLGLAGLGVAVRRRRAARSALRPN